MRIKHKRSAFTDDFSSQGSGAYSIIIKINPNNASNALKYENINSVEFFKDKSKRFNYAQKITPVPSVELEVLLVFPWGRNSKFKI